MRTIELTGTFKRDYKRVAKGRYREILESDFKVVVMTVWMTSICLLHPVNQTHAAYGFGDRPHNIVLGSKKQI